MQIVNEGVHEKKRKKQKLFFFLLRENRHTKILHTHSHTPKKEKNVREKLRKNRNDSRFETKRFFLFLFFF